MNACSGKKKREHTRARIHTRTHITNGDRCLEKWSAKAKGHVVWLFIMEHIRSNTHTHTQPTATARSCYECDANKNGKIERERL